MVKYYLCVLLGVVLGGGAGWAYAQHVRIDFELECFERGLGYYEMNCFDHRQVWHFWGDRAKDRLLLEERKCL